MIGTHLPAALTDSHSTSRTLAPKVQTHVKPRLPQMVIEHLLDGKRRTGRCISCYGSHQVLRRFNVIESHAEGNADKFT